MGDIAVGDLYELVANQQSPSQIDRSAFYQCRFCTNFEISGSDLCDSNAGRSHAAAHRLAFEALLEPTSFLTCPICDELQFTKEASEAIIFDCMFNDVDLVNHLLSEHGEMLSDGLLGDFTDATYLLTTFKETTRLKRRKGSSACSVDVGMKGLRETRPSNHDRKSTTVSKNVNGESEATSGPCKGSSPLSEANPTEETSTQIGDENDNHGERTNSETNLSDDVMSKDPNESTSIVQPMDENQRPAEEERSLNDHEPTEQEAVNRSSVSSTGEEIQREQHLNEERMELEQPCEMVKLQEEDEDEGGSDVAARGEAVSDESGEGTSEGQMETNEEEEQTEAHRPPFSRITCMQCNWEANWTSTALALRKTIATHVRQHIREESEEHLSNPNVFYAAKRLLCCMDFSLEEYFEKDNLSDLSGSVNAGLMEKTYHELLIKLFGISLPLVMRILHGAKGNPFSRNTTRRPKKAKKKQSKRNAVLIDLSQEATVAEAVLDRSSDNEYFEGSGLADGETTECSENQEDGDFENEQHIFHGRELDKSTDNEHVQCSRPECGHSLLTARDDAAIVRHVAAHIRHDEARLQRVAPPIICECGMAAYSPGGYLYHVFRDHAFERKFFNGATKTIMSYMAVVFDSTVRSGADALLASVLEGTRARIRCRQSLFCAHFSLEGDEGEEVMWSDCSSLNQDWMRLWAGLVDEDSGDGNSSRQPDAEMESHNLSVGDVIKLFEMHPFVEVLVPPSRRKRSYAVADDSAISNNMKMTWRIVRGWIESSSEAERFRLAPLSRWNQLEDALRRVRKECRLGTHNSRYAKSVYSPYRIVNPAKQLESIVFGANTGGGRSSNSVSSSRSAHSRHSTSIDQRNDQMEDEQMPESSGVPSIAFKAPEAPLPMFAEPVVKTDEEETPPAAPKVVPRKSGRNGRLNSTSSSPSKQTPSTSRRHAPVANLPESDPALVGKIVTCRMCDGFVLPADDLKEQRAHTALHAVAESRFLCSLYIHRHSDRPVSCPFCNIDVSIYDPLSFLNHIRSTHLKSALELYNRYLHRVFPTSKVFTEAVEPADGGNCAAHLDATAFVIRCDRSSCCNSNGVVSLKKGADVNIHDTDVTVLKHILWHIQNDSDLNMEEDERQLMSRSISARLSGDYKIRQITYMARKALKHWARLGHREADVVQFVVRKMNEIGQVLFGVNKGLLFTLVFPRRWVRDQSGLSLYPPCVCRLCINKELPRYSNDRRKRAFVAYAHPVALHILEHLNANELGKVIRQQRCVCPLDDFASRTVSAAVKHVLDSHNDAVEVNAFHLILEEMGVLNVFVDAMETVLGEQAWQLKEALGFDAFDKVVANRATFFDDLAMETSELRGHRAECVRLRDMTALRCDCTEVPPVNLAPPPAATTTTLANATTAKRVPDSLPTESMAYYREFLETDRVSSVAAPEGEGTVAVSTEEEREPSEQGNSSADSSTADSTPAPSGSHVKSEPLDEQSQEREEGQTNRQTGGVAMPTTSTTAENPMGPPLRMIPPQLSRAQKARMEKQLREMKRENRLAVPQRNMALPLKNVIQGSKTVAAAVAAALGTVPELSSSSKKTTAPRLPQTTNKAGSVTSVKPTVHIGMANSTTTRQPLGKRDTRQQEEDVETEESDLALGTLVKRPRTVTEPVAAPKKTRAKSGRKKKTTIADLLADAEKSS